MCSIIFKDKDLNQSTHKTLPDIIAKFFFFFFGKFFSKPSLITNFRVIENSVVLKYMLDKRIQQLKTIGVYTPKPKPNNVLIVIQK